MNPVRKIFDIIAKAVTVILLLAMLAVTVTSVSPIYDFKAPEPFSGPDIFNPYSNLDTSHVWKRANFHTHTRVEGLFNECDYWPDEVLERLERFDYDIVTFSNHNRLTEHPYDTSLQVNVYEHGYNLFKYHKLVFGCNEVNRFDHLVPVFDFQKQFQLDYLGKNSDFIVLNHPLRTRGTSKKMMERLDGYQIIELDSGRSTENEYWDWALSAGHYSFALANDDLHYPDRSRCIAVRCNFLCCSSASYEDIKETLLNGCYYSMRVPDYGKGDWNLKYEMNKKLPSISNIGLKENTIYISLTQTADSIKVTGQNSITLKSVEDTCSHEYTMTDKDPYARFTAYFPNGEVIWSNPFARYDSRISESPASTSSHKVNIFKTILFNLLLLVISGGIFACIYKISRK